VSEPKFVGFRHYQELAGSEVFADVLLNTLVYSCATVAATMVGGLVLALLLNRRGGFARAIQGCVFTSYIVSWVGVSLLWLWLLDSDFGLVNHLVTQVGLAKVDWLGSPDVALWALIGVSVWKIVGYDMVIFLAGLQSIPEDLYEAASLDGAGAWGRFRYVTVPLLVPTSLFLLVTSVVMTFQGFDVVRVMTQGGPVNSTTIYVFYVYEQAFQYFRVGYASAAVMVFFVLILAITLVQFRLFDREAT
jgi:sn-glycerol 3-phosphate transport system permease protein